MSIGIDGSTGASYTSKTYQTQKADTKAEAAKVAEEVTEEVAKKEDSFVKSTPDTPVTYKPDMKKVNQLKAEMTSQMGAFRAMVQSLLSQQGKQGAVAQGINLKDLFENITVDAETKAAAQASIEEGGEWSVDAVSERILDFAKAISGGDPEKIELLRKAVDDGFKAAEKVWGGKLPDISQKTYDKVMAGFDEWANAGKEESTVEETAGA